MQFLSGHAIFRFDLTFGENEEADTIGTDAD
jgi:hypothetical protein